MTDQLERLDSLTTVSFPCKVGYREFKRIMTFLDKFVLPCEVTYEVVHNGKIGQREDRTGLTLLPHNYVRRLSGEIASVDDRKRAQFMAEVDNNFEDEYLTATRISGIKFDSVGCDNVYELERMPSTNTDVMRRVKAGIEVYFGGWPESRGDK
ncbi:MAG: hypothetical protein AABX10_01465 [Nanoarchaeota archaeon]